ncbi:MAG: hypothetical protein ACJ72E_14470 [Marmoricola sp.]
MKINKPRRHGRRRAATILAAMGVLVLSSGAALFASAGSASAASVSVNICHATNSDTHPYNFITVDDDSAKFRGHLMHRNSPNKIWKTAGTFNGVAHTAGQAKPDLIASFTDDQKVFHAYDGNITEASCSDQNTQVSEATADVDWTDPSCANLNEASYDPTGSNVTFSVTSVIKVPAPGVVFQVTATADQGSAFSDGDPKTHVFDHTFGDAVDLNAPPCVVVAPPDVATAAVSFTDPTCSNLNDTSYTPTGQHVTFGVTGGSEGAGKDIEVTATADQGATFAGGGTTKVFTHHFTNAVDLDSSPCVDVSTPSAPTPGVITPTLVHAGLVSDVQHNMRGTQGMVLMGLGMLMLALAGGLVRTGKKA